MDEDTEKALLESVGLTQKLLSEHISKPVLAEKYLLKPPFRFLHEIITSVRSKASALQYLQDQRSSTIGRELWF